VIVWLLGGITVPAGRRRSQGGEFVSFRFFGGLVVVVFDWGFGFGGGEAVVFVEVELGSAAEVEGVLEAGKFADEVLQTVGTFLGIIDVPKRGDALADFDDEYPTHGFEGETRSGERGTGKGERKLLRELIF
jgi:hypothetical protein